MTKRGDTYLRTLLVHGARAAVRSALGKDDSRSRWVTASRPSHPTKLERLLDHCKA